MSRLICYADNDPENVLISTRNPQEIADALGRIGIAFEQWQANASLAPDADDKAVLSAYAEDIDRLTAMGGYQSMDVIRMLPDNPNASEMRGKFLSEHTHSDDEVRFFVEGSGQFCLHVDGKVWLVECVAGDLLNVPAGTRHWFDMGEKPLFTAIRLFISPAGWVADFTGDPIASSFPLYEREAA